MMPTLFKHGLIFSCSSVHCFDNTAEDCTKLRHKSVSAPNGCNKNQKTLNIGSVHSSRLELTLYKTLGEGACLKTDHDAIRYNDEADERLQVGQQADLMHDPIFGYPPFL